jgi:oligogalacturonide lyase
MFLFSGVAIPAAGVEDHKFPPEWKRYPDPTTEFEVLRLTDPGNSSYLPAYYQRAISKNGDFLLYSSDRTGSPQPFRMDLKTGQYRQLAEAAALDPSTLTLFPDDRRFCFFDGSALRQAEVQRSREREIYRIPQGWERCPGAQISADGRFAVFSEGRNGASRLQLVQLNNGLVRTVTEAPFRLTYPLMNPKRALILYRQGNEALWLVQADGQQNRVLRLSDGTIGPANWHSNGRTFLYLNIPREKSQLSSIREFTPDQNQDQLVARTSQFAHFGFNRDTSVFVGASRSKASPYLLLLLRMTRREFTICEHRASDPSVVTPVFSPDSQLVVFQSDRHGKPAIYAMRVDRLVEKTMTDSE